jgi:hypothetical protein
MYATANGRIGVKVQSLQNNYSLVKLCDRVALITKALKRKGKGGRLARVQAGYFGFTTRDAANTFAAVINEKYGVDAIVRTASRLAGQEIEVKVRDFDGLETLAWEKARKAEVTLQEARESLQQDCFYDANDTWSKPFYSEDGLAWVGVDEQAFECYSYEDWQADQEDLRASSSSF